MKAYWIGKDKARRAGFKRSAAVYRVLIRDSNEIIAVTDDEDRVMGFGAIDADEDVADIIFFYIYEKYRGAHAGAFLLNEMEEQIKKAGIGMLRFLLPDYKELQGFLVHEGFEIFPGMPEYVTTYNAIRYSKNYVKNILNMPHGNAGSVKDLKDEEKILLHEFLKKARIPEDGGLDKELSIVSMEEGKVKGLVLCEQAANGIRLNYMYADSTNLLHTIYCLRLLDAKIKKIHDEKKDLKLSFALHNDKDMEFVKYLVNDNVNIEVNDGEFTAIKFL